MLARSVIRVPVPGRAAWLPAGFAVLDRSGHQLLVLDRMLALAARIPIPMRDDQLDVTVSADRSWAAFASLDRTVVTDADGSVIWQQECMIERQGLPQRPAVHFDGAEHLWLYVPDGDQIAVFDAQTGEEIDRAGLSSCIGAGEFVAHPGGQYLGLSVAQGQDGTNSYWLHLDGGRIVVRELPGETLADVAPSGVHYLDLPHVDKLLAIRSFDDDHILASCEADDIPGFEVHNLPSLIDGPAAELSWRGRSEYGLNDGAGAYLDDDHVLVGVVTAGHDDDKTELHVVLSTRSLRQIATVDYGHHGAPRQNSITRGHDGRWLTYDWRTGVAALWEPDPTAEETHLTLFDAP